VKRAGRGFPTKIKVGYRDFLVEWMPDEVVNDKQRLGITYLNSGIIQINPKQDVREQVNTLFHEVMHAVWWVYGLDEGELKEERVILTLANGLCGVFRDNPELAAWMQAILDD